MERISAGTVPVENLREAVWMMLFRGEAEEVQLEAEYYPLPAGFIPQVTVREQQAAAFSGAPMNTGQTVFTWRWIPPAGSAFTGVLTWPDSYDAAEDHAASLLNIAEQGLVEGCAAQRAPTPSIFSSPRAHNLNDVPAESIEQLDHDFGKAFDTWKSLAACRR